MQVYTRELRLANPWRVAHGTSLVRSNVFVELGDGIGEAAIVPYYPHSEESVSTWLTASLDTVEPDASPPENVMARQNGGPPPARAALDMALHDRWARAQGQPLFRLFGLDEGALPDSSITLSIPDDEAKFTESIARIAGWSILKLKLGSGNADDDRRWFEIARERFAGAICIDANGGWDLSTAEAMIRRMTGRSVLFIEEPLRNPTVQDWAQLKSRLPDGAPPLLADESIRREEDIHELASRIDGINVKLAKAGGLIAARRWIDVAREYGMKVLVGCMVESSLAVTAAAHLAPLADFADLDGHLQISNDPFLGLMVSNGRVRLPTEPGLGVQLR